MRLLPKSNPSAEPPLVADAGLPYVPPVEKDPLLAWMELMEVVEALCPQWPERGCTLGNDFRL